MKYMMKKILLLFLCLLFTIPIFAQNQTIRGNLKVNGVLTSQGLLTTNANLQGTTQITSLNSPTGNVTQLNVDWVRFDSGDGVNLTNLDASKITSGNIGPTHMPNGTNAWSMNTPLFLQTNLLILTSGAATGGITGFSRIASNGTSYGELFIKTTGAITFTNPPNVRCNDGTNITSRILLSDRDYWIGGNVIDGISTNLVIVSFQ